MMNSDTWPATNSRKKNSIGSVCRNTHRHFRRFAWMPDITSFRVRPTSLGLCEQVPEGFQFAFKVTDEITIKKFPNLPRFGERAGTQNSYFLNAELFQRLFLSPC